jgi:hypothetical protein
MMAARMLTIAMTTSNSSSVNPRPEPGLRLFNAFNRSAFMSFAVISTDFAQ